MPDVNDTSTSNANQRYLSFSLGSEDYAVPLLSVREVIAVPEITPIPFTPSHFLGIMNLRGQVISIIDLRAKFGIKPNEKAETSVIICDLGHISLGAVVDSINSVLAPDAKDLSVKPEIQSAKNTDYITGVFRKDKQLIVLLDIARSLSVEDHKALQSQTKTKSAA